MTPAHPAPTLELVYDGEPILVQADDVIVGRTAKCTVRVVHPLVSREHCRIEPRADGLYVEDLGSVNGTWLNGVRVGARAQVHAGDTIGLGREGAILTVKRALVGGTDVSLAAREEDMKTMMAGDLRAAAAVARVEVASEAMPALSVADDQATRAMGEHDRPAAKAVDAAHTAPAAPPRPEPSPPTDTSAIPVVTIMPASEVMRPAHAPPPARPIPPRTPPPPPRPAAPAPPATDARDVTVETAPEAKPAAIDPVAPAPVRRGGFVPGFLVGLVLGLAAVAAVLKYTHLLDPIRPAAREATQR